MTPNLVSSAGVVPVLALAHAAGLRTLMDERLTVATDKGANAGPKVASLVGGMVAGADSIDDMVVSRHGGMDTVFSSTYAPSTPGSVLRAFTFGHVRQLDTIAARFLLALAARTRLLGPVAAQATASTSGTTSTSSTTSNATGGYATGEPALAKSTTATIRRTLITVPARVASSARRITLHLPHHWPWEDAWTQLFTLVCGPPATTART